VLLITAPVAAIAFVRAERAMEERGGVPLVPISLLRVPSMRRGLLLAVPFFTGFGGFMFVIALTLQDGSGITALDAGVILVPMALGFLAASLSTARLLPRFGRNVLTAGALIQAAGLLAVIAELARSWPHPGALFMAPGMLVLGIGQGLIMSPLFGAVLSEVPPRKAGVGSGVLATTQQGALALGVATLGSLYLTIAVPGSVGPDGAARIILGILVLNALGVGVMSRSLPALGRTR
jgi:predicted MFS family arabinose efflux permease